MGTETRLKLFIKVIVGEMRVKLRCNSLIKRFREEWKVGTRTEVNEITGV